MTTLNELHALGQSVWLDYIRRHLVRSGELAALIKDGLRGITSNPSIFEKAISGSTDYSEAIARMADRGAGEIFEQLAIEDIRGAADLLRPVYDESGRVDGLVSLEVSPLLANDTARTIDEAVRLWKRVERDNVMINVPATPAGIPAIRELLSRGINVNVTLLFSRQVFAQVAEAHVSGLEAYAAAGGDLGRLASVASFFVSRIDTAVDRQLEEKKTGADLVGKAAIANAKLAYDDWKQRLAAPRWQALAKRGARRQRVLWASTSTKDPRLPDVYYVEALIGRDTINTLPLATLHAFVEHGHVQPTLERDLDEARAVLAALPKHGVDLAKVTEQLTIEGVASFVDAYKRLLGAIDEKRHAARTAKKRVEASLPAPLSAAVQRTLDDWQQTNKVRRLWSRDASLWTGTDEAKWLDWLTVADRERGDEARLATFADDVKARGFTHVALLGMGGSSLCADVLARTLGKQGGAPELAILDSTDPAQIRAFEAAIELPTTLFIVSSKSGTTLEPNVLADYFYSRVQAVVEHDAGAHFVLITDPGSPLQAVAAQRGYWHEFFGEPGIGGRYSALSRFGMVPAAAMGIDVGAFLDRATDMAQACASCVPARDNPCVLLGAVLGEAAKAGRDKVTLVASPRLVHVGAWIEQLLAESTGKQGRGLIPIDREPLGSPDVYGSDRVFVYLRFDPDPGDESALDAIARSGQPVVRMHLQSLEHLGQWFFQWELATAVAGSLLGIDPFDQPDVEASKSETRKLTEEFERTGTFPPEPRVSDEPLAAFLRRIEPGDYFAILAYIANNELHRGQLDRIRRAVRDARHVATSVGFGPRFLHSTGQLYKGGPNTGVFLQLTCDDPHDVAVPGRRYTFGVVKAAQARGDLEVLLSRNRRVLRIHLGADVAAGLQKLVEAVEAALR